MQKIITVFETEIFEKICELDVDSMFDRCVQHAQHNPSITRSNHNGGYQSHNFQDKEFTDLILECFPRPSGNPNVQVSLQAWVNINGPGHFNMLHNHLDSDVLISGVFYVRCPPGSGELLIYDPRYLSSVGPFFSSYYPDRGGHLVVNPISNLLLFFSPSLFHMVGPNLSQEQRCSIAFNVLVASPAQNQ
jgi:hypothetical protein